MLRHFRNAAVAIFLLAAAGCGIKGPLVLPPPDVAKAAPAGTATPAADTAQSSAAKPDAAKSDTAKPAAPAEPKP